jgi:hypothetical protein
LFGTKRSTLISPLDDWGGRAAADWARRPGRLGPPRSLEFLAEAKAELLRLGRIDPIVAEAGGGVALLRAAELPAAGEGILHGELEAHIAMGAAGREVEGGEAKRIAQLVVLIAQDAVRAALVQHRSLDIGRRRRSSSRSAPCR